MKPILLIGKNGQVGWELQRALTGLGQVIALDRAQLDLGQPDRVRAAIREAAPRIIVNAAGYTAVDKAESEGHLAMQVNAVAPGIMAEESKRIGALLVHYSTDYVFDGRSPAPYTETDAPNPVNLYGKSKLAGERAITSTGCSHLILRASWIYSSRGSNFVLTMLRLAQEKKEIAVVTDQIGSPTWARALANDTTAVIRAFDDPAAQSGIYHLSAADAISRYAFAQEIASYGHHAAGKSTPWANILETTTAEYPLPAVRPLHAATSKDKVQRVFGIQLTTWKSQLHAFLDDHFSGRKDALTSRTS